MYGAWVAACVAAFAVLGGPRWEEPVRQARAEAWSRVIVDEGLGRGDPQLDPLTVVALVFVESSGYSRVRGAVGEVGLLQIHPATAHRMGYRLAELERDPVAQLRAGIAILRQGKELCGDTRGALAYHNTGACQERPRRVRLVRRVDHYRLQLIAVEPPGVRGGAPLPSTGSSSGPAPLHGPGAPH